MSNRPQISALNQTQGLGPLEDVYKDYVWTAVRSFCQGAGPASCQQSPVLGCGAAGNKGGAAGFRLHVRRFKTRRPPG
jgi:hypothetical protein